MKKTQSNPEQDPRVLQGLQAMKDVPSIAPAQQRRLQADFIEHIQQVRAETVTFSRNSRLNQRKQFGNTLFLRWRTSSMTAKIIALIVAITTVLSGAGAGTVYAAQSALPDDALYAVKLWSEEVQLDLAQAPEKDLALHLEFADRRVAEMLALQSEGTAVDPGLGLELTAHLWMAEQLAGECEDPLEAQQQIRQRLMVQEQLLTNAPEDALMTRTRQMVQQQLNLMECDLDDEECQQQACEDGGCMVGDQLMTHEQLRDQLREDQPEGAGSETGNGYTGDYPEPQQGKDEEREPGGNGAGDGNGPIEECDPETDADCPADGPGAGAGDGNGNGPNEAPGGGGNGTGGNGNQ